MEIDGLYKLKIFNLFRILNNFERKLFNRYILRVLIDMHLIYLLKT